MKLSVVTAKQFGKSKGPLKSHSDEHRRSLRNSDCEKSEFAKHFWEVDRNFIWGQKKIADRKTS